MKHYSFLRYLILLPNILIAGCCIKYTMNGSSLDPKVKTVSVAYIENQADIVAPALSQVLTEKLKNKFTKESSLKIVNENGDLQFRGTITNYTLSNAAQQGNNQVSSNRLTINVRIKCINKIDSTQNFENEFSNFADFPSSQTLSAVESKLISDISDLLVQDIFNKAVINW